jgi:hypothetical protein
MRFLKLGKSGALIGDARINNLTAYMGIVDGWQGGFQPRAGGEVDTPA